MADNLSLGFGELTINDDGMQKPSIRKDKMDKQPLLPVPIPTKEYMDCAAEEPQLIGEDKSQPLMIVLDLNGALLYRKKRGHDDMIHRPNLDKFINMICQLGKDPSDAPLKVHPFVWSSATKVNVNGMVDKAFGDAGRKKLVTVWSRSELRLGKFERQNPQVYKQLSWIWADQTVQKSYPKEELPEPQDATSVASGNASWSQLNTILIDDSVEKGAAEPHSIVLLPEFDGYPEDDQEKYGDVLLDLLDYLRIASRYRNVSAFVRCYPFVDKEKKWQALK